MNFAIRYLTRYQYDGDVVDNLNALRVKPASTARQRCDEFSVRLNPEVRLHRHTDYFGTDVVEFEVSRPHRELTIDVRARVVTKAPPEPPQATWEALGDPNYRESGGEFLLQTDDAAHHPHDGRAARDHARGCVPAVDAEPGLRADPRSVRVPPGRDIRRLDRRSDLLEGGAGVCQDFVHLGLCLLRHHGIAARYVSGYLFALGTGDAQESVEVDTHAWLKALLPVPGGGEPVWVGADPTNRGIASEDHVKIGHGRHYADVPPTKGVYRGTATATLDASVTMTRLDGVDPASIARA